jgi:hypothetical protein
MDSDIAGSAEKQKKTLLRFFFSIFGVKWPCVQIKIWLFSDI